MAIRVTLLAYYQSVSVCNGRGGRAGGNDPSDLQTLTAAGGGVGDKTIMTYFECGECNGVLLPWKLPLCVLDFSTISPIF